MDRDAHELADHDHVGCDHTAEATSRLGVLASPLARRRFLQLGGLSAAGAAVLVACGGPGDQGSVPIAGTAPSTTKAPDRVVTDATYLRTASSMEASLVETYRELLAIGTLPTEVAQTMQTFMDQHNEHLDFFRRLTTQAGGKEVSDPNPAVQAAFVKPALALAAQDGNKPDDLVSIALGVETLAAETFQQFTPLLTVPKLRGSMMSVGGVEARHSAILTKAAPTGQPVPPVTTVPATTTTAGTTTTTAPGTPETPNNAPVYQVPGPFQPLTSVQITIGIDTVSMDPLGPNSYLYEYNIVS